MEGELITDSLVRDRLNIPENERVVWLNATETVILDQDVTEGDFVDIVVVFQDPAQQVQTKRILTNIPVVEVDENNDKKDDKEEADRENPASNNRVKVSLPITDAEMVIHHQKYCDSNACVEGEPGCNRNSTKIKVTYINIHLIEQHEMSQGLGRVRIFEYF